MQEVHGKRHATEPAEEAVGEHIAGGGREVQANNHNVKAQSRREARVVWLVGEDGSQKVAQGQRPGLPLVVGVG